MMDEAEIVACLRFELQRQSITGPAENQPWIRLDETDRVQIDGSVDLRAIARSLIQRTSARRATIEQLVSTPIPLKRR